MFYIITKKTNTKKSEKVTLSSFLGQPRSTFPLSNQIFSSLMKGGHKDVSWYVCEAPFSPFIFTFMSKSVCVWCSGPRCARQAGGTHDRQSHSQARVGGAVRRGRRCETREGKGLDNENVSCSWMVIKYDLLWQICSFLECVISFCSAFYPNISNLFLLHIPKSFQRPPVHFSAPFR